MAAARLAASIDEWSPPGLTRSDNRALSSRRKRSPVERFSALPRVVSACRDVLGHRPIEAKSVVRNPDRARRSAAQQRAEPAVPITVSLRGADPFMRSSMRMPPVPGVTRGITARLPVTVQNSQRGMYLRCNFFGISRRNSGVMHMSCTSRFDGRLNFR
jgi:hypothetical protein